MNDVEKRFVAAYLANGGNATKAYLVARPDVTYETAESEGSKMRRRNAVQVAISKHGESVNLVSSLLTAQERRETLAKIVRANPEQARTSNPEILQSVTVTRRITSEGDAIETVKVSIPDKLAAIKLDAQLAGELDGDAPKTLVLAGMEPLEDVLDGLLGFKPRNLPALEPVPGVDDLV